MANEGNRSFDDYYLELVSRLRRDYEERRVAEREAEGRSLNDLRNGVNGMSLGTTRVIANPPLKIDGVFFYPKENAGNHRTTKFQLVERGTPVLRRGQSFFLAMKIAERRFDENSDSIRIVFNFGPSPSPLNGTQRTLKLSRDPFPTESNVWGARLVGHDKNAISVEIRTSSDSCVGIWKCNVETKWENGDQKLLYRCPDDIYLLFNPWERNDGTYMSDFDLLNEYVLEDQGKIWVGPHGSSKGRHWIYGQFDDSALPLIMIILEKSGLAFSARGSPILVSRALSKMVNSNDDDGLLVGKWDGKYQDGTAPSAWTGSIPIIEQYFQTLKPVKYGQCWVFSGVLCTVCRCLGIPARVISNLVSAHDSNSSLTIDTYFNDKNEEMEIDPKNPNGGKDSIWNFHVWNDVWFSRPDLPKGYGGWQAIDATPQERSEGSFQCGPASLEAVRNGQVGFAYDVPFVLAEVNADYVKWREDKGSEFGFTRVNSDKYHIGRMILTKAPNVFDHEGDSDRQDVTDAYKGKEGTRAERLSLYNAVRGTMGAPLFHEVPANPIEDMEFDLIDLERVPVGEPFAVVVIIQNKSSEVRSLNCMLSAESVYYTGVRAKPVKRATSRFDVQPNSREELKLTVTPEDYMDKLVEYGIMKIFAIIYVDETKSTWSEEDDFQVIKPSLNLIVSPDLKVGKPSTVTFSFKNPIKRKLTDCKVNYEGPALTRFGSIKVPDVEPEREFSFTQGFIPRAFGTQSWVATFSSRELIDIIGSAQVEISA